MRQILYSLGFIVLDLIAILFAIRFDVLLVALW